MPTNPNIVEFLTKYAEYNRNESGRMLAGKHFCLTFPSQLEDDEGGFIKSAAEAYRDTLVKSKMEQDVRKLIPDGNSYYFIRGLAKAHRMYRRSRINNACVALSENVGMADGKYIDNLKQLGTVDISPILGGAK
jgi:hypothetical protein